MAICTNCGAQIQEGAICACRYNQQQAQNQYGQQPANQYGQQPMNQYGGYSNPVDQKEPGKTMIKVVGIIMAILGALAVILSFGNLDAARGVGGGLAALLYYEFALGVITLILGIAGIVMAGKKEKAGSVVLFGVILLILRIVYFIWIIAAFGEYLSVLMGSFVIGGLIGCVLPILYIVGGTARKKTLQ